jgi:hypothetical protein
MVGPKTDMDDVERSCHYWGSTFKLSAAQTAAIRYTDCSIPAPKSFLGEFKRKGYHKFRWTIARVNFDNFIICDVRWFRKLVK